MQWFLSLGPVWQALLASLIMYAMTALGASFVFFSKKVNHTLLTALTGAAAGIMIAAGFFSLLLPAIEYESSVPAYVTAPLGFLLGGAFVILCDFVLSRTQTRFRGFGDKKNALLFFAVRYIIFRKAWRSASLSPSLPAWRARRCPRCFWRSGSPYRIFPKECASRFRCG